MSNYYKISLFIVLIGLISEFMWMLFAIDKPNIYTISMLLLNTFLTVVNTKTMFSRFNQLFLN